MVKVHGGPRLGGGASTTNDLVFTADGNHNFYAMDATNGTVLWTRHDTSGGGVTCTGLGALPQS